MSRDYVYENAPLIEVIAEVHWQLKPVSSAPDAQIDPLYDLFREAFVEDSGKDGLTEHERLVPPEIPVEFVANQPHLRLRSKPQAWPLVQIGPGVMTVNIVPPYNGWKEFSAFLGRQIKRLFSTYPLVSKALRISRLHLRYIDGFGPDHGFTNFSEFSEKMLGFPQTVAGEFRKRTLDPNTPITFIIENRYNNARPVGASGRTKLVPAKVNGRDNAVLELHCDQNFADRGATDPEFITNWFDQSHETLHLQFDLLASEELKSHFGQKREIA